MADVYRSLFTDGRGMAIAGITTGAARVAFVVVIVVVIFLIAVTSAGN